MNDEKQGKDWFEIIFNQNYQHVLNYLFYLSGDIALSEDLAQDAFLQLWDKRHRIKNETMRQYLFTIARNSFLKSIRRQNYDLKFRSDLVENLENESPEFVLEVKEYNHLLQEAIAGLPEKCRVVFLMNRIDGMSYREISESLGVGVKAVEKQMSKALSLLRVKLGNKL